ncbi:MAG: dihydrodipicolinate synthase family protein [Bowdeniella nasicola]|nr:dihydrodipicolinate synthase family protein [Bowdeniella nasicola]
MTRLHGVIPPVVTPLTEAGHFDPESFDALINHLIDGGVHGLFILGSTSEVVFSTDARRREILTAATRAVAGRVPIIAGVIDTQTARVLEHIRTAEDAGVDAVVTTAPFYALGGPAEVERHFRVLAANTSLPIYAYDLPVCVHTKLGVEMLLRLGQEGVIAGVKDSSGDDVSFRRLALHNRAGGEPLALLTGHEVVVDGAYLAGAHGCVPGLGNIDPAGYVRMWDAYQAGDWEQVRTEQDRLAQLMEITAVVRSAVGFGAGVGAFKTALQLLGIITTNTMPEPVAALKGADVDAIAEVLCKCGLLA